MQHLTFTTLSLLVTFFCGVCVQSLPFRNPPIKLENKNDNQGLNIADHIQLDLDDVHKDGFHEKKAERQDPDEEDQGIPVEKQDEGVPLEKEEQAVPVEQNIGNNNLKFLEAPRVQEKPLDIEKLRPADHMEGVKMEQDGHVNKDFHKEMFLGKHEEFEGEHFEEAESKLKDIVRKVDSNQDGKLSLVELETWVLAKMDEHFSRAKEENEEIFKHLDPDLNGKVHWKEYYVHFLLAKGYDKDTAEKHVVDYDQIQLSPDGKEEIIRYKFRWSDADGEPQDNELTREEFSAFRHPEQSEKTLRNMVNSIMSGIDKDGDGSISEDEYASLPPGEVEGEEYQAMDKHWVQERRQEFRNTMDLDHSGKVTKDELKKYLDPQNPTLAMLEAKNLISIMDNPPYDNMLTLEEIMKHKDIFVSSKVMNFARNVHDEF